MSSLSRFLLRGNFSFSTHTNRRFFSAVTAAAATPSPPKPSLITLVNDERDPKFITEKFKKACQAEWFRKNIAVYERTVRRLAAAKKFEWVEEILEEQNKYPNMSKEGFVARIINLYGRVGMFENAQKVFDEMPERNCKRTALSFNALLNACVNSKKFDLVEGIFKELPGKLSIEPDVASYNTLIKGLCGKGSFTEAVALIDEIENKGLKPDHITFNILLHESYTKGKFEEGEQIWARMVEKNVKRDIRSYNARLLGLAMENKSEEMVSLFDKLKGNELKPDVFTFTAMIKGFVSEGKLDEAITWYKEIEKNGCRPLKFVFNSLLPAICKGEKKEKTNQITTTSSTMANVFLISSRNRRSMRTTTESKPKNLTVKRSDSSSDYNYSCKKHPKHRQSPGICSLCLNESLSKLSSEFYDYSSSMSSSSLAKTMSSCSSASSESESDFSSTAISSYYSSVSSCLSPLQHRYSEIVVNKKKKKHVKKQSFLSRLFL